jgi:hypothetical protein
MTTILIRAAFGLAAAAGVFASNASANSEANCDWYAKTALKQQQENEQKKCGFTGPNWTNDLKAHTAWCIANPDQFRAEAQRRDQQLATCKK